MNRYLLPAVFFCLLVAPLFAADNLLPDPNLSTLGKAGSQWQVSLDKGGKVEATVGADGTTPALHLTAAIVEQGVSLPLGDYELTVQAKGSGELLLSANGDRSQMLGSDWGTYGYLFHAMGTQVDVSIEISGDGMISSAAIKPATPEQVAALQHEADERLKVGYVTVSAQRPTPGVATLQSEGDNVKPLTAMNQLIVLDEPRFSTVNAAHVDRLVNWLKKNGFTGLDGDQLIAWMTERIEKGDGYGSVVVLPRGVSPAKFIDGPQNNKTLWLSYLRAGGRLVHMGDVPFNYLENIGPEPSSIIDSYGRGLAILGLDYASNVYCGGYDVTPTVAAKAWGFENADGGGTGVPVENTTQAFHVYMVPKINKQGAGDYFRNLRPDMPWSGLVKILQSFDGNNDSHLRDVWRAATYVGQPVTIPPLPGPPAPPAPPSKIQMSSDGVDKRHEFVRGEEVSVNVAVDPANQLGTVRLDLMQDGKTLYSETHPGSNPVFTLKTAPYADDSYDLQATVLQDGKTVETESEKIGIRYLAPEGFMYGISYTPVGNPLRNDMVFTALHSLGMEFYTTPLAGDALDSVVRNHESFCMRGEIDMSAAKGKGFTYETHPEYYKMTVDGKPVTTGPYSGGRPMNGYTHPDILENIAEKLQENVRKVAQLPSLRPYILTNDDFSSWYGFDYSPHITDAFKADTGLDVPRKKEMPANFGAFPDSDPWFQWMKWTMINVNGKVNKVETEAATKVRPDIRIGPIPGGMGVPLIGMDPEAGQYPPYDFGKGGFNLIASYYYNTYFNPTMATVYWMEAGRMGNRDLPEWNMPDVLYSNGYTQNEFYLYMAGRVRGLVYFRYEERTKSAWDGVKHVAPVVRRIGPVQMEIKPAHRDIGILSSLSTLCFYPNQMTWMGNAEENLVQGHFSVEMTSEEDILAGQADQYKAIYLYSVRYLRQSVYNALAKYAANGGLVLMDATAPFDIPGAKRLNIDTAEGTAKTLPPLPVPPTTQLGNLAVTDYGRADRIALVQAAVSEYVKPQFDSSDIKVAAYNFANGAVPYTWFVNVEDGKEYDFSSAHCNDKSPKSLKEVTDWEDSEIAKGPYTSTITYDSLPGIPYDLVNGKKLNVTKTPEGRYAVDLSMDRFGGILVAWYPSEITGVRLSAPQTVKASANQTVHIVATVMGQGRPLAGVDAVQFTWHDPSGKESMISGVRAAKNGAASFDWTPAINDPTGNWTLEVKELASGKTAQAQVDLSQ